MMAATRTPVFREMNPAIGILGTCLFDIAERKRPEFLTPPKGDL
jgi:hypothetical protein